MTSISDSLLKVRLHASHMVIKCFLVCWEICSTLMVPPDLFQQHFSISISCLSHTCPTGWGSQAVAEGWGRGAHLSTLGLQPNTSPQLCPCSLHRAAAPACPTQYPCVLTGTRLLRVFSPVPARRADFHPHHPWGQASS